MVKRGFLTTKEETNIHHKDPRRVSNTHNLPINPLNQDIKHNLRCMLLFREHSICMPPTKRQPTYIDK